MIEEEPSQDKQVDEPQEKVQIIANSLEQRDTPDKSIKGRRIGRPPISEYQRQAQRRELKEIVERAGGDLTKIAVILNLSPASAARRLNRAGIYFSSSPNSKPRFTEEEIRILDGLLSDAGKKFSSKKIKAELAQAEVSMSEITIKRRRAALVREGRLPRIKAPRRSNLQVPLSRRQNSRNHGR